MAKAKSKGGARKKTSKKTSKRPAASKASRPRSGGGSSARFPIICSECYSEFSLTGSGSSVTCPECMHKGSLEAADVMAQATIAKNAEKGWLVKGAAAAIAMVALGIVHMIVFATSAAAEKPIEDTLNYSMLGGLGVLFIITVAAAVKYESSRHDVYF